MTYLNELLFSLTAFGAWAQTSDGTNSLAALICMAALCGAGPRLCLFATLALHLVLIAL